jgi:transcriptional regulator
MYSTPFNRVDDRDTLVAFMRSHPFATLVTRSDGRMQGSHLPFHVALEGDAVVLYAHMARPNPQWRDFAAGGEAMAVFLEPHAYVSPRHYANPLSVPTWNYAAVHAYGTPRLIEPQEQKHALMMSLIGNHDAGYLERFPGMPGDYVEKMLAGVAAFAVDVTRLESRFKLSQEKSPEDRARIIAELEASDDSAARATAALMRAQWRSRSPGLRSAASRGRCSWKDAKKTIRKF